MSEVQSVSQPLPTHPEPMAERAPAKAYRGMAMEGSIARWYARTRGTESQLSDWRAQAEAITRDLPSGASVLEVAPGPGYFAVELARLGRLRVSALDISATFVGIVRENAQKAGVDVSVRQGDASRMPYADSSFDLIVCQAAFKNFSRPQAAVDEMFRVLRPRGIARIQDMHREASDEAIQDEVDNMQLGFFRALMTRSALRSLRRRAYTVDQFQQFVRASPFREGSVEVSGIGLELLLRRP